MKIESVDFFYLSMPEVLDIGDGSQDALLVRIRAGGLEGWGECEASPLPTIASYFCPMSHSGCKPVQWAVDGMPLKDIADIQQITKRVHENCFDLLQSDHTLSGIDMALYDLLGKYLEEPAYRLIGYPKAYPKLPYSSELFGDTPEETFEAANSARLAGYRAVKFGWGPFGKSGVETDEDHLRAARAGLKDDLYLMVDVGTAWNEDVSAAKKRLQALKEVNVYWLEEPFVNMALGPYREFAGIDPQLSLAAGEGCNNYVQAAAMIEYAGLQFVQIDAGRIGGITTAKRVADLARAKRISYVNHTFTSHLALSASIQPFAGIENDFICEYPVKPKALALDITREKIHPDENGMIVLPQKPGLGVTVDIQNLKKYLVDVDIHVKGKQIYYTPEL